MRKRIWIDAVIALTLALAGCSTTQDDLLNRGSDTMLDIWNRETGGSDKAAPTSQGARQMQDARMTLRRPLAEANRVNHAHYTRTAQNEIHRQFHRLPNPELVLYVFPHLAGSDPVPVPGYSTVFTFYRYAPYAMPGERIRED